MRRTRTTQHLLARGGRGLLLAGLTAVGLFVAAPAGMAQSPDPVPDEPAAGAWLVTDADGVSAPSTLTVHADGTLTLLDEDRQCFGVWEENPDGTVIATMVSADAVGTVTSRALVTVTADGETFSATYTVEPRCACGEGAGQFGPGHVTAVRIHAETPGTPVAPIPVPEPSPDASLRPAA